ncbi:AAR2, putative [Babesia ovis]|uniref:AAR2, putative n=1 Tax=Babesia ovis TaxID=5869 RepID=A0A9W5T9A0_BABOV|nr:AAR2, putative [Babesia ovis]
MDIDEDSCPPSGLNLTTCLVLNQRSDEILGFDFVSFPRDNEVVGVINLTPGAHFIYVKEGEPNEEIDRRLGDFVYIPQGTCTVLKRSKYDDGPLFELLDPDESRSYHNAVVAGHFHGKLSRIPENLQNLWYEMTEFITEDVIRLLRPIAKSIHRDNIGSIDTSYQGHMANGVEQTSSNVTDVGVSSVFSDAKHHMDSAKYDMKPANENVTPNIPNTHPDENMGLTRHRPSITINTSGLSDEQSLIAATRPGDAYDDTAEDYKAIAMRFKNLKTMPGLICETFAQTSLNKTSDSPQRDIALNNQASRREHVIIPEVDGHSSSHVNAMLNWEAPRDQCTIYYSDIQKLNRKMGHAKHVPPSRITALHIDTSYVLDAMVKYHHGKDLQLEMPDDRTKLHSNWIYNCVLGEYQYAFCVFLLNFHYVSFEHWKSLFRNICNAECFLLENIDFSKKVLNVIRVQLETFESDLYDPGNFFAYHLSALNEIIADNHPRSLELTPCFQAIRDTFKLKFGISLDDACVLHDAVQVVDDIVTM